LHKKGKKTGKKNALPTIKEIPVPTKGGIPARQGFSFQDHVAARYVLQLVDNPTLLEVICEAHDDIVLIWRGQAVTYVQAKNDKAPWTMPRLVSSRVFEKSLQLHCTREATRFCVVVSRASSSDLSILKQEPGNSHREANLQNIMDSFPANAKAIKSHAGSDYRYWLRNVVIEETRQRELAAENQLRLARIFESKLEMATTGVVEAVYKDLVKRVQEMAELDGALVKEKTFNKKAAFEFLDKQLKLRSAESGTNKTMIRKMREGRIEESFIKTAEIQLRDYLNAKRQGSYRHPLEIGEKKILSELQSLRIAYDRSNDGGQPIDFYEKSINRARKISGMDNHMADGVVHALTSRCQHRYVKA